MYLLVILLGVVHSSWEHVVVPFDVPATALARSCAIRADGRRGPPLGREDMGASYVCENEN